KAGLYPETKAPEVYGKRGFDMEGLLIEILKKNRLDSPGADPKTPVIIQSFSAESLRKLRSGLKTKLPLIFLIGADPQNKWLSVAGLRTAKDFGAAIAPSNGLTQRNPETGNWEHPTGVPAP